MGTKIVPSRHLYFGGSYAKTRLFKIFLYTWLVIGCIFVLTPVLWMVGASFTKGKLLSNVPLIPSLKTFSLSTMNGFLPIRVRQILLLQTLSWLF